jgi:hypothetical protein
MDCHRTAAFSLLITPEKPSPKDAALLSRRCCPNDAAVPMMHDNNCNSVGPEFSRLN